MTRSERNKQYYQSNRGSIRAKQRDYHRSYYQRPEVKRRKYLMQKFRLAGFSPEQIQIELRRPA